MNNAANEVKVKNQESAGVNKKKKIIFLTASIVALLIIFFIYTTYNQQYVGASDWYGYYSLSLLLKQGRVDMEVGLPPARYPPIAPLSYFVRDGKVLQQYPPGYPFLMALTGFIGLEFYVTPIMGILSIVLMFLLIKDLTDQWIAALFSLLWAFTPIVVYGSTSVMSDLPATVFILLSLYFYRKKKIIPSALALGFSLVVRPTNVL
jgi:4-amino-4-deoxy-L-arabinose transferase-like glycosyltransferase